MAASVTKLFALTTRGLEAIARDEIESVQNATITGQEYRQIHTDIRGDLSPLLSLRSVDDIFILLETWSDVTHTREMLATIEERISQLSLVETVENIRTLRPINTHPSFSVSASFIGKRNYTSVEIKKASASAITKRLSWRYTENDRDADLNFRVFILHKTALLGLRLGAHPLHERPYKTAQIPGSLKPSIAAAMASLAGVIPGQTVVDPCCGAGTIVIESALQGAVATGYDIDPNALESAQINAKDISTVTIQHGDARSLAVPDQSVDCVISNLPWGKQIKIDGLLDELYHRMSGEIERIIKLGGRAVLLTPHANQLHFKRLKKRQELEISVFGQNCSLLLFD